MDANIIKFPNNESTETIPTNSTVVIELQHRVMSDILWNILNDTTTQPSSVSVELATAKLKELFSPEELDALLAEITNTLRSQLTTDLLDLSTSYALGLVEGIISAKNGRSYEDIRINLPEEISDLDRLIFERSHAMGEEILSRSLNKSDETE